MRLVLRKSFFLPTPPKLALVSLLAKLAHGVHLPTLPRTVPSGVLSDGHLLAGPPIRSWASPHQLEASTRNLSLSSLYSTNKMETRPQSPQSKPTRTPAWPTVIRRLIPAAPLDRDRFSAGQRRSMQYILEGEGGQLGQQQEGLFHPLAS